MKKASNIVVKILSIVLLTAAVLKGWQLLTEPVANNDIWSYRPFLILTVEFELALAIWLLSGLFKKAAWLATLLCFSALSAITLYKGITGAESCGCFGSVHINPWITLFAIDLPAVIALSIFRPRLSFPRNLSSTPIGGRESIKALVVEFITPLPSLRRFVTAVAIGFTLLSVTTPILAFNEPPRITSRYEVLEPETWIGKKLHILKYIDIGKELETGNWVVLFYYYDCPDCQKVIPQYEKKAFKLASNKERFIKIALIEIPPYGDHVISLNPACFLGKLSDGKKWLVATPVIVLLSDGTVLRVWSPAGYRRYTKMDSLGIYGNSKRRQYRQTVVSGKAQPSYVQNVTSETFMVEGGDAL